MKVTRVIVKTSVWLFYFDKQYFFVVVYTCSEIIIIIILFLQKNEEFENCYTATIGVSYVSTYSNNNYSYDPIK